MGYSKNNTLHSNTDDFGVIIDGCGNTSEKKYYYNGIWIDLCGLPISEYMRPTIPEGGISPSKKKLNQIVVTSKRGVTNYELTFVAQYAVTSTIKMKLLLNDTKPLTVTLNKGEKELKDIDTGIGQTESFKITFEGCTPQEDINYAYKLTDTLVLDEYYTIYNAVLETEVIDGKLKPEFIEKGNKQHINAVIGGDLNVTIPKLPEGTVPDPDNPIKYAVIILIPLTVFESKDYQISEGRVSPVTSEFLPLEGLYFMDGLEYVALYRTCEGNQYAAREEEKTYIYQIKK